MSDPHSPDASDAALWDAVALLSSLRAAFETAHARQERKAGRDPSAQEAHATARAWLEHARAALREELTLLRLDLVLEADTEDATAAALRELDTLLRLGHIAQTLHRTHQRLLSLYPDVDETLVEAVRRLRTTADVLDAQADRRDVLARFTERAFDMLDALDEALA